MSTQNIIESLPDNLRDSYYRYIMKVNTNIALESVILNDYNKSQIDDFITETRYKAKFMEHGFAPVNRLMFYGASGTGKTYLSKALTNFFGYTMLYVDISSLIGKGTILSAIEEIFKLGNYIGKAVIMFDECDAVCWDRSDSTAKKSDDSIRHATNAIFQNLDQMNPECIFIAATNLYDNLDTAFKNRFNLRLRFDKPVMDTIDEDIRKIMKPEFELEMDFDESLKLPVQNQAKNYDQMSYRLLTDWVERAEKMAIMEDSLVVKESVIYKYMMEAMRLRISTDNRGKPYLYNE